MERVTKQYLANKCEYLSKLLPDGFSIEPDYAYGKTALILFENGRRTKHLTPNNNTKGEALAKLEFLETTIISAYQDTPKQQILDYRGYKILDYGNGVVTTISPEGARYVVGMDDSKRTGKRTFANVSVEDAQKYIDWVLNQQENQPN